MIAKILTTLWFALMAGYIIFELVWPSFARPMLRFRIKRWGVYHPEGRYQLQCKHWPWSPWWSDYAWLEGYDPSSQTMFHTREEAITLATTYLAKLRRIKPKDKEIWNS